MRRSVVDRMKDADRDRCEPVPGQDSGRGPAGSLRGGGEAVGMSRPLEGRTAIITGASQGLGLAIAEAYVRAGANVLLCARDADTPGEGPGGGTRAWPHRARSSLPRPGTCRNPTDAEARRRGARGIFPRLHILVNNAGVYGPMGRVEEVDWEEWVRAIEINLLGSVLMCRAVLPHFRRHGYGKIIQLSGGGATNPLPRISAYAASKAAVVRFAETLAEEVRRCGIDVNAIAPGALNTRLLDEVLAAGPGEGRERLLRPDAQAEGAGGRAAGEGRRAGRVPRVGGQRRHHRQADQRRLGSVGEVPGAPRRAAEDGRLHAAADRPEGSRNGLGGSR